MGSHAGASVAVHVPAKINLFLAVRGRRADGYHEVASVYQTVAVHDVLRCSLRGPRGMGHHPSARGQMGLHLVHDAGAAVPTGMDNLVVRAAVLLGARTGIAAAPATATDGGPITYMELSKRIPVAGGMAGGSADAAAALIALNELWRTDLPRDDLRALAADLGADVPFCVVGGTALATGTGTNFAQVLCRGVFHWVIGIGADPLPTADVYRAWDAHCSPSQVEPDAVLAALRAQDAIALGAALYNDLQPAAFHLLPRLREDREALLDAGALGATVSGSGPTLLALCADLAHAHRVAGEVQARFADALVATSPAGAPLVAR